MLESRTETRVQAECCLLGQGYEAPELKAARMWNGG